MKKMSDDPELWPKQKERIFIVGPVRNAKLEVTEFLYKYAEDLEKNKGCEVFLPKRDNPYQDTDKIGIQIITLNREKMIWATQIHIWYDKNSEGSGFDLGMFWMALALQGTKKFRIINDNEIALTPHKSFTNVILDWREQFGVAEDMLGDLY